MINELTKALNINTSNIFITFYSIGLKKKVRVLVLDHSEPSPVSFHWNQKTVSVIQSL